MRENPHEDALPWLARPRDEPPESSRLCGPRDQKRPARPHRLFRTWLIAAAAVSAGAIAVVLLAAPGSHASSALATVTGALAQSSTESSSFGLEVVVPSYHGNVPSVGVSGAFDPGTGHGTEVLTTTYSNKRHTYPVRMLIRFIGSSVYTSVSPGSGLPPLARPWDKSPVPPVAGGVMSRYGGYGFVSDRPVSLAGLSRMLQSAGTAREQGAVSGRGWAGSSYSFTARLFGGQGSVSGTVYLDKQGRVRRLVTITTQGGLTTDRYLTLTGFGERVAVVPPAASQVQYTSTPYWGFYF